MNTIFNRRSVRKFTNQDINPEDINLILKAAMEAPSASNEQPWDFIVVRNKETMLQILDIDSHAGALKTANVAVVVCGDKTKEKYNGYWVQDCSASIQNILLEATDLGIGSVWLSIYPDEERVSLLKPILNIPENVTPLAIIALGYPDENQKPKDNYKPERIHTEKW